MSSTLQEQDYTQKFSFSLWKRILRYTPAYYSKLIRLGLWMVVTAVIDIAFPLMTRYAIDTIIPSGSQAAVPAFALGNLLNPSAREKAVPCHPSA